MPTKIPRRAAQKTGKGDTHARSKPAGRAKPARAPKAARTAKATKAAQPARVGKRTKPAKANRRVAGKRHSILVAVDFSEASRIALEAAGKLAADLGADIVLLHASPTAPPPVPFAHEREAELVTAARVAARDAARLSAEWADPLRQAGVRVQTVNPMGPPVKAILDEAKHRSVRLVVLGTKGRTGIAGWVMGSTAKEVIRRSRVPVLVAPLRMKPPAAPRAASGTVILAAVDFSEQSNVAYEAALRLAKDVKSVVRLLHVLEPLPSVPFPLGAEVSADYLEHDEEAAGARLAKLASKARASKVGVTPSLGIGHPASVILAEARMAGASLIVVGTHGKSAARRFLLGSVAESVVQLADRPVLVVPDPGGTEAGAWVRSS